MSELTDLEWLVREYCVILWHIEHLKNFDYEAKRQRKHIEIAQELGCTTGCISPVLHNIEYNTSDGYLWIPVAMALQKLKDDKLLIYEK